VTSTGSSGDLRRVFPVMVADRQSISAELGSEGEIRLDEEHEAVRYIKDLPSRHGPAPVSQPSPSSSQPTPAPVLCAMGTYWDSVKRQCF